MKAFNGLSAFKQFEGKALCMNAYKWLESLSHEDFNLFAKNPLGGALIWIANQYANEFNHPVFYIGMYDTES